MVEKIDPCDWIEFLCLILDPCENFDSGSIFNGRVTTAAFWIIQFFKAALTLAASRSNAFES
jgi:hypothetical protein